MIPRLLAARPTNVLTNGALTMLPILVLSDLQNSNKTQNECTYVLMLVCERRINLPDTESSGGEESSPCAPVVVGRNDRIAQM